MGALDQRLIATLLLSVLSSVLMVGMFLVYFLIRRRQRHIAAQTASQDAKNPSPEAAPACSVLALKRPSCWLAIKNRNLLAVQNALALHNPKPCSWAEGLSGESDQKLFVSPPISGWILVIGSALPDPADDVDACFRFMLDLSRKLGHVQYFSANAVLNQHAWAQADGGRILRGYAWSGKTLWNQGILTPAEVELGMKCYGYCEAADDPQFGQTEPAANNPEKVHLLAARWSVDPDALDDHLTEQAWGIVGQPSRRF